MASHYNQGHVTRQRRARRSDQSPTYEPMNVEIVWYPCHFAYEAGDLSKNTVCTNRFGGI